MKIGSGNWNDLAPYGTGFILVGDNGAISSFNPTDGGVTDLGGGTCGTAKYLSVSVRPIDQAVFITAGNGNLLRWLGPRICSGVNALTPGYGTAVRAYDNSIFVAKFDAASQNAAGNVTLTRLLADGGAPSTQNMSSAGQVWDLSGPSPNALFAAGWDHQTQQRSRVWGYDQGAATWSQVLAGNNSTPLYAIDVPTPTLGFAAGDAFYQWNGFLWTSALSPPFSVFGLKVISATEVYAVGTDSMNSIAAMALWNGTSWTLIGPTNRPMGSIARVRGASRCTLLGVGSSGNAMTTFP